MLSIGTMIDPFAKPRLLFRALRLLTVATAVLPWSAASATSHSPSCHSRSVPLQLRDGRALVSLKINGQATQMILDTGTSETVLFNDTPERLGLKPSPGLSSAQTTSYGQALSIRFARADTLDFAGSVLHAVDLAVLPTTQGGTAPTGFFADPRMREAEFDLPHDVMRFACPTFAPPRWARQSAVTTVPLEAVSRVFGAGSVKGVEMRILFDTGSPTSSMTLAAAQRAGIVVDGATDSTVAGLAPGSALRAWRVRVDAIRLGNGDPVQRSLLIVDKPHANADMIMGFDFFRQHRVWIDRSRQVLRYSNAPDHADETGEGKSLPTIQTLDLLPVRWTPR